MFPAHVLKPNMTNYDAAISLEIPGFPGYRRTRKDAFIIVFYPEPLNFS